MNYQLMLSDTAISFKFSSYLNQNKRVLSSYFGLFRKNLGLRDASCRMKKTELNCNR